MNEPLSYFVKYIETIENIDTSKTNKVLTEELNSIVDTASQSKFDIDSLTKLQSIKDTVINSMIDFSKELEKLNKNAVKHQRKNENQYLSSSYRMYDEAKDSAEYILDRAIFKDLFYNTDTKNYFISRLQANSDWKHPGLFIRPELGDYVDKVTASDPLYVVDTESTLLEPCKKLWSKDYQARIRYSVINEDKEFIFKNLPQEQFGLIVAVDYFNYRPVEIIKKYATEIFNLLKPGGVFIFTYNNCNLSLAVKNFERAQYSYTPKSLVVPLLEMKGFEIIEAYDHVKSNTSWLEIKKPGNLSSLRGGQCLGKINV